MNGKRVTGAPVHALKLSQTLLASLDRLRQERIVDADRLHRLRVGIRRLQAWFRLIGAHKKAAALAADIAQLSPLRAAQVFDAWLAHRRAPAADRRKVRGLIRQRMAQLDKPSLFGSLHQTLASLSCEEQRIGRLQLVRCLRAHREKLTRIGRTLPRKPKRKALHRLRLRVKQLRYQLEWTSPAGAELIVPRLKRLQRRLGAYEDLAAFHKLGEELSLSSQPTIVKAWRKARKKARRVHDDVNDLIDALGPLLRAANGPRRHSLREVNAELTAD